MVVLLWACPSLVLFPRHLLLPALEAGYWARGTFGLTSYGRFYGVFCLYLGPPEANKDFVNIKSSL